MRVTISIIVLFIALLGNSAHGRVIKRDLDDPSTLGVAKKDQSSSEVQKSRGRSEKRDTANAGLLGAVLPSNGQAATQGANIPGSILGPDGLVGKLLSSTGPLTGAQPAQPASQPASAGYYYYPITYPNSPAPAKDEEP